MTIPQPTLTFDDAGGGAALSSSVKLLIPAVTSEGQAQGPEAFDRFGLLAYRQNTSAAALECWDDNKGQWIPDPENDVASVKLGPLSYKKGDHTWQAFLVAASKTSQYEKANSGYPLYSFKACFIDKQQVVALSPPSVNLKFVASSSQLYVGPAEGDIPPKVTKARFELRDANQNVLGQLLIDGTQLTLSNSSGAKVQLNADGSVAIVAGGGKGIHLTGTLFAQNINYSPIAGGGNQDL